MIEPPPCATIFGAAARQVSNVVPRWASTKSRNCSLVTLRIDSLASPAVPAQFTKMSIRPNSCTQVSINASAMAGSAGEPANATAPVMRWAATVAASSSRPLTTTPAPWAASISATAKPTPRVPPTTTAPRPARCALILLVRLGELHGIHVPVPTQVGDQAGIVDLVGERAAHGRDHTVGKLGAQHQNIGDLGRRARRERLFPGHRQPVRTDVRVVEGGNGILAAHAIPAGIREGIADRVLDDDIVGHQRQPALFVAGLHAAPRRLRCTDDRCLLDCLLTHFTPLLDGAGGAGAVLGGLTNQPQPGAVACGVHSGIG